MYLFKMRLQNLPEEILIIIIRSLNFESINSLYEAGSTYINKIICMNDVVKMCHLSQTCIHATGFFQSSFFKRISCHMVELDVSGVKDITKSSLLTVIKKLKNLKTLNVSYTKIEVLDLIDICKVCPTIKNIVINFTFRSCKGRLSSKIVQYCQNLFRTFENVHFISSFKVLLLSGLPCCFLEKAKLDTLKYTIAYQNENLDYPMLPDLNDTGAEDSAFVGVFTSNIQFINFELYILYWRLGKMVSASNCLFINSRINSECFEYVAVVQSPMVFKFNVYCSPLFEGFIKESFGIQANTSDDILLAANKNLVYLVWNKNSTAFDNLFFINLRKEIEKIFPCNYLLQLTKDPAALGKNNIFVMTLKNDDKNNSKQASAGPLFKKARVGLDRTVLSYDEEFKDKTEVELHFFFDMIRNPISLSSSSNYLKKISYLNLNGPVVYSPEFFNVLFCVCKNLRTLNVNASAISSCVATNISKSIAFSLSMKNIRIIDKRVDFIKLFSSFSECPSLENIHVHDISSENNDIADPSILFRKCNMLYCISIQASMAAANKIKKTQLFNKAKSICHRPYLYIELYDNSRMHECHYDPYLSVFKVEPIKELKLKKT